MHLNTFFDIIYKFKTREEFIELRFSNEQRVWTDQVWYNKKEDAIAYVKDRSKGKNCYFGIHPRFEKGGTTKSISNNFSVLYVDVDFKNSIEEDVSNKIAKLGILPTIKVFTGHGLQLWFALDKPTTDWNSFQKELLRLIRYFNADDLHDKPRVFRLPTTYNVKSKPYFKCKILFSEPDRRYSLTLISTALTKQNVPLISKREEQASPVTLSPTLMLLGFQRYEDHFRNGECPRCHNNSLYVYDNNPKVANCSHTGNCKFTCNLLELEKIVEKERKKSDAVFNKEAFVRGVINQPPAVKVGYSNLDKHYHFRAGTINLIAGRLGHGKSTVVYNMLLNAANAYPEGNFLLFTYEIPKELVFLRLLTIEYARAAKRSIEFKKMEEEVKTGGARAQVAMKRLERLNNIFVYDDPELSIEQLQEIVTETPNVGAIGIDYLECVKVKEKATEELRVSSISTGLKKFAIKTNSFPIWLLSQLNRSPKERKDQRPREEDVRYSDKALQDSAIGWGLYNPSMNRSLSPKNNKDGEEVEVEEELSPITNLEIIGLKNRYGRKTREILTFDQASGLITQDSNLFKRTVDDLKEEK